MACGEFRRHLWGGKPKRCSRCNLLNPFDVTWRERFWEFVNKNGPTKVPSLGQCWEWIGAVNCRNYGVAHAENNVCWQTHRLCWTLLGKPLRDTEVLRHKCDYKRCVNPDHLETGTQRENLKDRWLRHGWPTAKLTNAQVLEIRSDKISRTADLAARYGVKWSTIHYVRRGITF